MKLHLLRAVLALSFTLGACGDAESPADSGMPPDQGVLTDLGPSFACGAASCPLSNGYCLEEPTGPCEARDGGACGPNEQRCAFQGTIGCTTPLDRRCETIPAACGPLPPCACLPDEAPCARPGTTCFRPEDGGPVVTCGFP